MTNFKDLTIEEQDVFIPIGTCKPTHWLIEYNLRFHAFPFDWIHNIPLSTVTKIIEDDFVHFLTNVEEVAHKHPLESIVKNRYIQDLTFNFVAMHHFSKSKTIKEQIKPINKKHRQRGKWFNFLIKHAPKICLFTNYEYEEKAFTDFIDFMEKKYPKTQFTIINCHHTPNLDTETIKTEIFTINNTKIINLKFNNTYTGDTITLKSFGNQKIYEKIMPKLKLSEHYQIIRYLLTAKSELKKLLNQFLKNIHKNSL